jgi:hypothetical protein
MKFCANSSTLPYCCGVVEAGDFEQEEDWEFRQFCADTAEELVRKLLDDADGIPVIFNFVKEKNYDDKFSQQYNAHELRAYVAAHPKAIHLIKFINPNSGNRVDSYMIKEYKDA